MKQQQELLLLLLLCHKLLLLYNSCKISHDVNVVQLCWYNISLQSWYTPPLMYMHVVLIPVNRTISWKNKNRSCCIARIYCALLVRSFFIQRLHWGKGNNNSCVPKLHWGMNPPTLMSNTLKPGEKSVNNYKQGYVQTHRHMTMVTHTFCMGQYGLAKKKRQVISQIIIHHWKHPLGYFILWVFVWMSLSKLVLDHFPTNSD